MQDAFSVDEAVVRALIAEAAPPWVGRPLARLASSGTDNALFRLGEDLLVRLPRRREAVALIAKEMDWLPHLDGLPLRIPTLRLRGRADLGTPVEFGVFDWIDGEIAAPGAIADPVEAALSLASFLDALHAKPTAGAPAAGPLNMGRGLPLDRMSDLTLKSIVTISDEIDAQAARRLWETALSAGVHGSPVWLHGDLKADNLIASGGKLTGVIDWGLAAVGDPAADYAAAWSWVDPAARTPFRDAARLDDDDWARAQGWALYGAAIALSFYRGGKNEVLCRQSRLTLSRLGLEA